MKVLRIGRGNLVPAEIATLSQLLGETIELHEIDPAAATSDKLGDQLRALGRSAICFWDTTIEPPPRYFFWECVEAGARLLMTIAEQHILVTLQQLKMPE